MVEPRRKLRELFAHVMDEIDIRRSLARARPRVESFPRLLGQNSRPIRVIAFGKAAVPMALWFREHFHTRDMIGVVSHPGDDDLDWPGVTFYRAGHPTPNEASIAAGRDALQLAQDATEEDTVVFLISGGGSALLEYPVDPSITLDDVRALNQTLVTCGADIVDMNVVRKHLSAVKGGRLAAAAHPAHQLTIYVSDVPPGEESSVASGPTMPDESSLADLKRIVERHGLMTRVPRRIARLIADARLDETPKPRDRRFDRSQWVCVLDNSHAVEAAVAFARDSGWSADVDMSVDDMDVEVAAEKLLSRLRELRRRDDSGVVCIVTGGELSSPVRGKGVGGRNQAFVLACSRHIEGENIAVMSVGTDGVDGNSPAAGAVADGTTLSRAAALGMDVGEYAARSDSNTFFRRLGDDIACGPTKNNVRDVRVMLAWR